MKSIRLADVPMIVKIGLAPALGLVALALVAFASLWSEHQQSATIERIANKDMVVSLRLVDISKRIAGVHGDLYVLLTQQAAQMDPAKAQSAVNTIDAETDSIKSDLTSVQKEFPLDQRKQFAPIIKDLTDYRGAIDVVGSMLGIDFKTAQAFVTPFEAHYQRMTSSLNTAAGAIKTHAVAEAKASAASAAVIGLLVGVASFVALLAVGCVAVATVFTTRSAISRLASATESLAQGDNSVDVAALERKDELGSIVRSLGVFRDNQLRLETLRREHDASEARETEVRQGAERLQEETSQAQGVMVEAVANGLARLSQGDLTIRLSDAFAPEYEQIRSDFNATVTQLQETMRVVGRTVVTINAGSEELADASNDLSRRTEQQAASLEETAMALTDLTGAVKQSASSAQQASEIVTGAKGEATSSGEVVKQAVSAMSKIEQSSREISNIIGVIDEIAFQTNLLALNAGVEAARAGDSGRGFAVVASEVRALAQRSAGAAKEIKGLISTSTGEVKAGVSLVNEAGAALQRIIAKVVEIDTLIVQIASVAKTQATGVGELNVTVGHMDQMTQQNAAMVQEATAATQTLKNETVELKRLIATFNTGTEQPPKDGRRGPRAVSANTPPVKSPARQRMAKVRAAHAGPTAASDGWEEF